MLIESDGHSSALRYFVPRVLPRPQLPHIATVVTRQGGPGRVSCDPIDPGRPPHTTSKNPDLSPTGVACFHYERVDFACFDIDWLTE